MTLDSVVAATVASTLHLSMLAGAIYTSHTTHDQGTVHALLSFLVDRCELSSATKRSLAKSLAQTLQS
ncbi:hypothetical protein PF010_g16642 [Phytophthora fragariae]|uniref:Uncharacterized protein n=1 Tax=Phytophthora fragariae TaxID=53985 RepID=A0A6A4A4E4_9STRA|nr:hypothetical protein PF003_g23704 [Phytophthora fragariae]KAE8945959.1 hypothetical protein PF009_g4423 [Phytophthora fragariae]KAE9095611.1 hypothetical protein PF010_g16642 [Phytophthora fragariae]KAE9128778.1 hypothetical protein PF007_g5142 [Phytophthora fragariae]KAE9229766.1 hypothetical protein PF004_g10675 [Phytophthora fragariae]